MFFILKLHTHYLFINLDYGHGVKFYKIENRKYPPLLVELTDGDFKILERLDGLQFAP